MKIAIIIADFYKHIADMQLEGACKQCEIFGLEYDIIRVAGALEIPPAISILSAKPNNNYAGYVALGCVIRGETSHYDTVCNESARGLMDLGVREKIAIGNGILTVENEEQALVRADINRKNKAGEAVVACYGLIQLNQHN
jgi:6,7-dimethyl-8-ribityllumazine synthase